MNRLDIWMLPFAAFTAGGNFATGNIFGAVVMGLIAIGCFICVIDDLRRLSVKPL